MLTSHIRNAQNILFETRSSKMTVEQNKTDERTVLKENYPDT